MAMSDTMSSSPSTDWVQFYQLNLAGSSQATAEPQPPHGSVDATVVTTTITSATTPGGGGSTISGGGQLSPEGRVSKPPRRRRASRAAPTTLLNTDTANFRAMVQQFTGVPSAPFTFGTQISGPNLSFGLARQQQINVGMGSQTTGYNYSRYQQHHQAQAQQQQQQQQFYHQRQQPQQYVFPFNNSTGGDHIGGFGSNNNTRQPNMEISSDGFLLDGQHQVFHGSSASSNGNRSSSHGYNL